MQQRPICDADTLEFKSFLADGSRSFTSSHPSRVLKRQKGLSRLIQKAMSSVYQPCDYITQTVVHEGLTSWLLICWGELVTQPCTLIFDSCILLPSSNMSGRQDSIQANPDTWMHKSHNNFACSTMIFLQVLQIDWRHWIVHRPECVGQLRLSLSLPSGLSRACPAQWLLGKQTAGPTHPLPNLE